MRTNLRHYYKAVISTLSKKSFSDDLLRGCMVLFVLDQIFIHMHTSEKHKLSEINEKIDLSKSRMSQEEAQVKGSSSTLQTTFSKLKSTSSPSTAQQSQQSSIGGSGSTEAVGVEAIDHSKLFKLVPHSHSSSSQKSKSTGGRNTADRLRALQEEKDKSDKIKEESEPRKGNSAKSPDELFDKNEIFITGKFDKNDEISNSERWKQPPPTEYAKLLSDYAEPKCPKMFSDFNKKVKPIIQKIEDSEGKAIRGYLTVAVSGDPSNQIDNVRQGVWLAARLGRIFILPPVFEDENNGGKMIEIERRFSISTMRNLLPVVTAKDFRENREQYCGSEADSEHDPFDVYVISPETETETENGHRQLQKENNEHIIKQFSTLNSHEDLDSENIPKSKIKYLKSTKKDMFEYEDFKEDTKDSKCLIWVNPTKQVLDFTEMLDFELQSNMTELKVGKNKKFYENFQNKGEISLMVAVTHFLPRPQYIQSLAKQYVLHKIFGDDMGPYICVHWRFGTGSGFSSNDATSLLSPRATSSLASYIDKAVQNNPDLKGVYLVFDHDSKINDVPGLFEELLLAMSVKMKQTHPDFRLILPKQVEQFVRSSQGKCSYLVEKTHFEEMMEQVDLEVASLAEIFVSSSGSDWSRNVMIERHVRGLDGPDFDNSEIFGSNNDLEEVDAA